MRCDTGLTTVWKEREGGWVFMEVPSSSVSVEFLPEPVVWKDGDALRTADGWTVWVRRNQDVLQRKGLSRWHCAGLALVPRTDAEMEQGLAEGRLVRLVPEVK